MAVTDNKMDRRAKSPVKTCTPALVTVASKTNRPFAIVKPGYRFRVTQLDGFTFDETGAVTLNGYILGSEGLITAPTFTVHSTPEQMAATAFVGRASSIVFEKAAATAITFSAAHVITASKYGIILIQVSSAGVYSTKVPSATQAYNSAAEALAALPEADAGKTAVARLAILNNAGDWTANTDDLTNGSDLATAAFTSMTAQGAVLSSAVAFADGAYVEGALSATLADLKGEDTDSIVLVYTADGTGALVTGHATLSWRPRPLQGEV